MQSKPLFIIAQVAAIILLLNVQSFSAAPAVLDTSLYQACANKSAVCFGLPENCVTSKSCSVLFKSHYTPSAGFQFTLVAPSIATDHFIAVAFSTEAKMSGFVVQCLHSSKSNTTPIQFSINEGHHNTLIANAKDVTGFTNSQASYSNSQLTCTWADAARTKVTYKGTSLDFENVKYFIKLATGKLGDDGNISYHGKENRIASSSAISLKN